MRLADVPRVRQEHADVHAPATECVVCGLLEVLDRLEKRYRRTDAYASRLVQELLDFQERERQRERAS